MYSVVLLSTARIIIKYFWSIERINLVCATVHVPHQPLGKCHDLLVRTMEVSRFGQFSEHLQVHSF
jgi:hypothetical protein